MDWTPSLKNVSVIKTSGYAIVLLSIAVSFPSTYIKSRGFNRSKALLLAIISPLISRDLHLSI